MILIYRRSFIYHRSIVLCLAKFDQLERRVDYAEGRADAIQIGESSGPSLSDEIAALEGSDAIDDELAAMKKALGKPDASKGE